MVNMEISEKIGKLRGPILVLGASGFVGANLFRSLLARRSDVYGVTSKLPAWRLEGVPRENVLTIDLNVPSNVRAMLEQREYQTVFDCVAYGAYSFQEDLSLIYETNINRTTQLTQILSQQKSAVYIHAGSSSEYGDNASAPKEDSQLTPNSHYAVTKAAVSGLLYFLGKKRGFACANLRLYAVFGPMEDSSRLIPVLIQHGMRKELPPLVDPEISRDFVYVDDVSEAFVDTAIELKSEQYGESFNVGSGKKTTIRELAGMARELFGIVQEPAFASYQNRKWDTTDWYCDSSKLKQAVGWEPRHDLRHGLLKTLAWFQTLPDLTAYEKSSKKYEVDPQRSISAVVACYKDVQAIPIMYEELARVFKELRIDYEIIFVNDNSPDNSEEVIRSLSQQDRRVIGISHSRNFGSQSAFRSGMEVSTKRACVLLDGDLQDPPEVIAKFVEKWKEGYEVVFGRRVKRVAPFYMQFAYKAFYYFFNRFSYIVIPRDAGDFSLIDRRVVDCLLRFPERDLFLRGIRAFAGFRQVGVDYVRPERRFGRSTNNLFKNIGWAKKGILSFSNFPLNALSFCGFVLFAISMVLMLAQIGLRIFRPDLSPRGVTTIIVIVIFFSSLNVFALSLIGEYLGKVFEEVKRRPHFIRRNIIQYGEVRSAGGEAQLHLER